MLRIKQKTLKSAEQSITSIANNVTNYVEYFDETSCLLETCQEWRNIFRGVCQLFMNISSLWDIQWILAKEKFVQTSQKRDNWDLI